MSLLIVCGHCGQRFSSMAEYWRHREAVDAANNAAQVRMLLAYVSQGEGPDFTVQPIAA